MEGHGTAALRIGHRRGSRETGGISLGRHRHGGVGLGTGLALEQVGDLAFGLELGGVIAHREGDGPQGGLVLQVAGGAAEHQFTHAGVVGARDRAAARGWVSEHITRGEAGSNPHPRRSQGARCEGDAAAE